MVVKSKTSKVSVGINTPTFSEIDIESNTSGTSIGIRISKFSVTVISS